ncbi:MAG: ribosome silencing factor [Syntrophomonadaceae bacterium]|nr:ribosome silencing factor [Syntrophomonadaceae bacterium]
MINDNELIKYITDGCSDEKADDLVVLDVRNLTSLTEYFIITSGRNPKHVQSISDNVNNKLSPLAIFPLRREGYQEGAWIINDYNSVILHIFCAEKRNHYDLERLWGEAPKIEIISN